MPSYEKSERRGPKPKPLLLVGQNPLGDYRGEGKVHSRMRVHASQIERLRYRRMRDLNNNACKRYRRKHSLLKEKQGMELYQLLSKNRKLRLQVMETDVKLGYVKLLLRCAGFLKLFIFVSLVEGATAGSQRMQQDRGILLVSCQLLLIKLQQVLLTLMA